MTDYDPEAWILGAARRGKLKRYDQPDPASWSAYQEYLSLDEAQLAERLLGAGAIHLGRYDRFTDSPYWEVGL